MMCVTGVLSHLEEGDDLRHDGLDLSVQLLGINLGAAHVARPCTHTHTHHQQVSNVG